MDTLKAYGAASSSYAISDIACEVFDLAQKEKNEDAKKAFDRVLRLLDIKKIYYTAEYNVYMKE